MLEASLPNPTPTIDGGAGRQEIAQGQDGVPPPWSHAWYDDSTREKSHRTRQRNGQNARAGPSMPLAGTRIDSDDSSDDEGHVPYKQVSVAFVSRLFPLKSPAM